jgi:hypothetical protein
MKCNSKIQFGDDKGNNGVTFHCQLEKGHKGKHKETGKVFKNKKTKLYRTFYSVEWGNGKEIK